MTNGWKTWAPARCGRLLLLCVGLAVAQTALAEPSEAQMRAAIEAKFGNVNAGADETAQRCNNREYNRGQGDPVLAMQCLAYGIGGGVTNGGRNARAPQFKLTRFEKIACEKAQGKAGRIALSLLRMDLVILDELGYLPFSQAGGALLFHLRSAMQSLSFGVGSHACIADAWRRGNSLLWRYCRPWTAFQRNGGTHAVRVR